MRDYEDPFKTEQLLLVSKMLEEIANKENITISSLEKEKIISQAIEQLMRMDIIS